MAFIISPELLKIGSIVTWNLSLRSLLLIQNIHAFYFFLSFNGIIFDKLRRTMHNIETMLTDNVFGFYSYHAFVNPVRI